MPDISETDQIQDVTKKIDDVLKENRKKGFKSNNRVYRKVFNKVLRQSRSIDQFGDDYFCSKKEDETVPICVTLPASLVVKVDEYCKKKGVSRSRLIRKIVIYSLNLEKTN